MNESKSKRKIVAVCGKGGAGKTVISSMIAGALGRMNPSKRILLIDADPAGGLAFAMGVKALKTIGEVREDVISQARSKEPSIKEKIAESIDYYILEALVERQGWSLLAMGRGESVGCFCPVNTLLREAIEALAQDFSLIIIDGEAGIEQINRQVMRSVDTLLVISDVSARGFNTVSLIKKLVLKDGALPSGEILVILNRVKDEAQAVEAAAKASIEPVALVPEDPRVSEWDAKSHPLFELGPEVPSMGAIDTFVRELFEEIMNAE